MDLNIAPGTLAGNITPPSSKSVAHRAILCAALCREEVTLTGITFSDDIVATVEAVKTLGKTVLKKEDGSLVFSGDLWNTSHTTPITIDCHESGSTARFLIPIAAALGRKTTFMGRGQLPYRHFKPIIDVLKTHGVQVSSDDTLPLSIEGQLSGHQFSIAGDLSSQFITGLLFALPLLGHTSELLLTTPLSSRPYVEITRGVLQEFGVDVCETACGYQIPADSYRRLNPYFVEADYSNAAFFLAAGAIGPSPITVQGLNPNSRQGDQKMISLLQEFGAKVTKSGLDVTVSCGNLKAIDIDAADIPDLVPILAVVASYAKGITTISHVARLRAKESDRLKAISDGLNRMGGHVIEDEDSLQIEGIANLKGDVTVSSYQDHRIAMALSIAALGAQNPITLTGAQCVEKSYPNFYEDYKALGGKCHVVHMG